MESAIGTWQSGVAYWIEARRPTLMSELIQSRRRTHICIDGVYYYHTLEEATNFRDWLYLTRSEHEYTDLQIRRRVDYRWHRQVDEADL